MENSEVSDSGALDPAILEELARAVGLDTARIWATNVQVFKNPHNALIVFREVVKIENVQDGQPPSVGHVSRNVASVVMPEEVMRSLAEILKGLYLDNNAGQS